MANSTDVLSKLITALTVSDSTWDVSVGSATYKILESVAEQIADANNNSVLQTYSYDVNTKFGTELDAFCNLFGIARQIGKRSTGTVVFSTPSSATANYYIPIGTQIYASSSTGGPNVFFSTTAPAVIAVGQTSAEVPVISVLPGTNSNVAIGAINTISSTLTGITSVINPNSLSGGADTETDSQLQNRFRSTAFSNISGTNDKYTSVALQNSNVSQVNVIGAQERYREQLIISTVLSGAPSTSTGILAFQAQSQLSVISGSTVGSLVAGSLPAYRQVTSGFISQNPSGIFNSGSVTYDGTNYNLDRAVTSNGVLTLNYVVSGTTSVTISGGSTVTNVFTAVSGILDAAGYTGSIQPVINGLGGSNVVASGVGVQFTLPTLYNLIVYSGTVSATNTLFSQIPDSKYTYPQGGELVGLNLGSTSQTLFVPGVDYNYPTSTVAPFKITLNPLAKNAPYTYTGNGLEVETEYVPNSSRIVNPQTNSNIVDIFINAFTSSTVSEQVILVGGNKITTSGGGGAYQANNFIMANGGAPTVGDYYIALQQQPLTNFPAQIVAGNEPSYITFSTYNFPIALKRVPDVPVALCSGTPSTNQIFTNTSISGLLPGMVVSGTGTTANSGRLLGIPSNSYITSLIPGSPNRINLNSPLTASGLASSTLTFTVVAYPVYDNTTTVGSINDISGVAFKTSDPSNYGNSTYPSNGLIGTLTHTYNSDVQQVDDLEQQARTVGTNLLVHQAQLVSLIVNLSVVYDPNYNVPTVNSSILTTITDLFKGISYAGVVRFSDIVKNVLDVQGVVNVRIATSSDSVNYGIKSVTLDGSTITQYTKDIILKSNQLPSLYSINVTQFGQNNF